MSRKSRYFLDKWRLMDILFAINKKHTRDLRNRSQIILSMRVKGFHLLAICIKLEVWWVSRNCLLEYCPGLFQVSQGQNEISVYFIECGQELPSKENIQSGFRILIIILWMNRQYNYKYLNVLKSFVIIFAHRIQTYQFIFFFSFPLQSTNVNIPSFTETISCQ